MKKTFFLLALLTIVASCVGTQTRSGVSSGLVSSWQDTISGVIDNSVNVERRGEACSTNILGIIASGDSSIEAAKRNGGIQKVAYADTTYFNILGLYQKGCTVAKGQ
jgi:hypothetical protein